MYVWLCIVLTMICHDSEENKSKWMWRENRTYIYKFCLRKKKYCVQRLSIIDSGQEKQIYVQKCSINSKYEEER